MIELALIYQGNVCYLCYERLQDTKFIVRNISFELPTIKFTFACLAVLLCISAYCHDYRSHESTPIFECVDDGEPDTTPPTAVCMDITLYLDEDGMASITPADLDAGSTDDCEISSFTLSQYDFVCTDIGLNEIEFIAFDPAGNSDTCISIVNVLDTIKPEVNCLDISVYLDETGNASITAADLDAGSSDACGISISIPSKSTFTCDDLGPQTVKLYMIDNNGNMDSCAAIVTVKDTISPEVICKNPTVYLNDEGTVTINSIDLHESSSDICGIASIIASDTTYDCADVGVITVDLMVMDIAGNSKTCISQVSVLDTISPVMDCLPELIQHMDANCELVVPDYGDSVTISDNCTVAGNFTTIQSPAPGDILTGNGTTHTITLTMEDESGNSATCTFDITIQDNTVPELTCPETQYITTDATCTYVIPDYTGLMQFDPDNCDGSQVIITQVPEPGTTVTADNSIDPAQGFTQVSLRLEDFSGNSDTCNFTVIVTCIDEISIPELLTPNGDGKNDILKIEGIDGFPENELKVFNRWGNIIYSASPYENNWSGEADKALFGGEVTDGSYFYKFFPTPGSEPITGYIVIKR